MNAAMLYAQNNAMPKNDARHCLNVFKSLLKWDSNENILDVGSADGGTLIEELLPNLPSDFNKLLGVDISEEMVDFAKSHHSHPKVDFAVFNIASPTVPDAYKNHFHHIFSFNCLHFVRDQRKAMQNIFDMMIPGGQLMLTIQVNPAGFQVNEKMAKIDKWTPYMSGWDQIARSYYRDLKDPAAELKSLLEDVGFRCQACELEEMTFVHPNVADHLSLGLAVNPFLRRVPAHEKKYFIADYLSHYLKVDSTEVVSRNDGLETIVKHYKSLRAIAFKSVK